MNELFKLYMHVYIIYLLRRKLIKIKKIYSIKYFYRVYFFVIYNNFKWLYVHKLNDYFYNLS